MKLETVKIADLKPVEKNVRKHTDTQLTEFVKSLKQFGQTRPFVIDEQSRILIGNGMHAAMKMAGITEASAYRVVGLSESQKKKLMLTDNKIYSLATDDFEAIEELLREFAGQGDFDIPGFDPAIIESLAKDQERLVEEAQEYGKIDVNKLAPLRQEKQIEYPDSDTESAAIDREYSTPAEQVKTVMCPNCGEVIRI